MLATWHNINKVAAVRRNTESGPPVSSSVGAAAWMPGLLAVVAGVVIAATTSGGPWLSIEGTTEPVSDTVALHGMDATRTLLIWIGVVAAAVGVARLLRASNTTLWSARPFDWWVSQRGERRADGAQL